MGRSSFTNPESAIQHLPLTVFSLLAVPRTAVGGVEVEQPVVFHEGVVGLDPLAVLLSLAVSR
jgi:hypothetical protein